MIRQTLLAIVLFLPALCRGQESCLWMNAATACGILGGAVTASVSPVPVKTDMANAHTANAKSSAGPTSASAAGTSYGKAGMDDSDCDFNLQPGPIAGRIRIEVRTLMEPKKQYAAYAAKCGTNATPLKAVGNEASSCLLESKPGQTVEMIVGRVRDRVFVLRIDTNEKSERAVLDEKVRRAADIIAGNLF